MKGRNLLGHFVRKMLAMNANGINGLTLRRIPFAIANDLEREGASEFRKY
ncbi:MAG: hypothetical protein ACTS6P_01750 [Candidatus Hodgkinia cicadicola]